MKKKFIALLSVIAVFSAFAGCQSQKTEDNSSESEEQTRMTKLSESVDGKCWIGTQGTATKYALAFSGDKVSLSSTENGENNSIEGYWSIEDNEFYICSDAEKTEEIGLYSLEIPIDGNKMFIRLNDVVLAPTEDYTYDNISDSLDKLDNAAFVGTFADNSIWTYEGEDAAAIFTGNTIKSLFYEVRSDGKFFTADGYWGIDDKNMYFFDGNNDTLVVQYEYSVKAFDITSVVLTGEGTEMEFTSKSDVTDIDAEISKISNYFTKTSESDKLESENAVS